MTGACESLWVRLSRDCWGNLTAAWLLSYMGTGPRPFLKQDWNHVWDTTAALLKPVCSYDWCQIAYELWSVYGAWLRAWRSQSRDTGSEFEIRSWQNTQHILRTFDVRYWSNSVARYSQIRERVLIRVWHDWFKIMFVISEPCWHVLFKFLAASWVKYYCSSRHIWNYILFKFSSYRIIDIRGEFSEKFNKIQLCSTIWGRISQKLELCFCR